MIAAEVGHLELAYDYFGEAALMDLDDLEHNTRDGLHIASLAGAWIAAVAGFGGMRDHEGRLTLSPRLPEALTRLVFSFRHQNRRVRVEIDHRQAVYTLAEGEPLELIHHGDTITIATDAPVTVPIPPGPARGEPPKQPPGRAPARADPRCASATAGVDQAVAGASIGPATGSPPRLMRAASRGKIRVERIAAPTRPAAVDEVICPASIASVVIAKTRGSSVAE